MAVQAAGHPYVGQKLNVVRGYPDQATPDMNYGELTFLGEDKFPKLSELSAAEKYMLAGTSTCPFPARSGLPSWQMSVWTATSKIYSETGSVPAQLTPDVLRASKYYKDASDAELSVLRSPITGAWPCLNAKQFSAGNLFIHPLTQDEMKHFAAISPIYRKQWFEGKGLDASRLATGDSVDGAYVAPFKLDGPVWYIRMYGQHHVLVNTLQYVGHTY